MTLWQSRSEQGPTRSLLEFTGSLEVDYRLFPYDIQGSKAWAEALRKADIFTSEEVSRVKSELDKIKTELESREFEPDPELEDIHMNIESELSRRLPELGPRLHTGRSRNDQILVDVKLYLRDVLTELLDKLTDLMEAFFKRARAEQTVQLPGFTHLQPAQPITLGHYLLAFFQKFRRDHQRLRNCLEPLSKLPLGSGALAGSGYEIDREFLAEQLGFETVSKNSLDTVSERDFMLDILHGLTLVSLHASRLCEEWIIWSSPRFGFCYLDDEYTTGSSIMPQKKNPDLLELIRGQTGRISSAYQGLTTLLKGQPLAYNRDLQEDKHHLFSALDSVNSWLPLLTEVVRTTNFDHRAMENSARNNYLAATDLAGYLVEKDIPFREAHNLVRELVDKARHNNLKLEELSLNQFQQISAEFEEDIFEYLKPSASLKRREISGGTGPEAVKKALAEAEQWLKEAAKNGG